MTDASHSPAAHNGAHEPVNGATHGPNGATGAGRDRRPTRTAVAAIGATHRLLTVTELAQLRDVGPAVCAGLDESGTGYVLVSTCNRFELYVEAADSQTALREVLALVENALPPGAEGLLEQVEVFDERATVQHLFEVASGLQSMLVGENEVLGQVRDALTGAGGHTGPALHRLFENALATGKAVSATTGLTSAGRSLAAAGLDLAATRHGPVAGRRVLLVGTGSFARVATLALRDRGCTDVAVYSSSGRAERFADSYPVTPITTDQLNDTLADIDAVVLCSGKRRDRPVLTAERVARARADRTDTLPILDLSLRADIAPEVADLPGVDLIDLDEIGAHTPAGQRASVQAARDLVADRVEEFLARESGRTSASVVTTLRNHVAAYIQREVELAQHRYDPDTAEAVAKSLRRVSNSLLHTPSVRAADFARQGSLDEYSNAIATVFGIEVGQP